MQFTEIMCSRHFDTRSHLKVKCLSLRFISTPYLPHALMDFHETWLKCLAYGDSVHKSAIWLKVKVTLFKLLDTFLSNLVTFILSLGSVKNLNIKLSFDPSVHLGAISLTFP